MNRRSLAVLGLLLATATATAMPAMAMTTAPATPPASSTALMFRANHVALRVADVDASVAWWQDAFGAREVRRSRVANIDPAIEIVFLHIADELHVEIVGGGEPVETTTPADIAADYRRTGYKHIGFQVADLERALAHLATHGVTPEYRIQRPDYGVSIALIREPSGRYVELYAPLETSRTGRTDR
ncbi:MAG: VOC family protein [Gammaproteobacteria bacterium]|nr:VOC family protein [Gammaproteobacteria bacterium]